MYAELGSQNTWFKLIRVLFGTGSTDNGRDNFEIDERKSQTLMPRFFVTTTQKFPLS